MARRVLLPLGFIWDLVHSVRRFLYKIEVISSHKFRVPIISIGNLSFGGTNKTPFTLYLSELLNRKVGVLMRGYKGALEGKGGLLRQPAAKDFGDEAVLLYQSNPKLDIVVGKNRSANLEKYYDKINSDVILLDDGFQHLKIKRDLDIVLLDTTMELRKYNIFPVGNLRENLRTLKNADVIVYTRCDQVNKRTLLALKEIISKYLQPGAVEVESVLEPWVIKNEVETLDIDFLKGKRVIAFCAIGNPGSFFTSLEKMGAKVFKKFVFRDHHFFTEKQLNRILKDRFDQDTLFITTEKDYIRLPESFKDGRILCLGVRIRILKGLDQLEGKIASIF